MSTFDRLSWESDWLERLGRESHTADYLLADCMALGMDLENGARLVVEVLREWLQAGKIVLYPTSTISNKNDSLQETISCYLNGLIDNLPYGLVGIDTKSSIKPSEEAIHYWMMCYMEIA